MNAIETLAKDDPARVLIAEILSVVRVSHWSFARFRDNGPNDQLISSRDTENRRDEFEYLEKSSGCNVNARSRGPAWQQRFGRSNNPTSADSRWCSPACGGSSDC